MDVCVRHQELTGETDVTSCLIVSLSGFYWAYSPSLLVRFLPLCVSWPFDLPHLVPTHLPVPASPACLYTAPLPLCSLPDRLCVSSLSSSSLVFALVVCYPAFSLAVWIFACTRSTIHRRPWTFSVRTLLHIYILKILQSMQENEN